MFAIKIPGKAVARLKVKCLWPVAIVYLVLGFYPPSVTSAADLQAYTEEWPPYNFFVGNEVKGISSDILRATCESEKIDCQIQLVPWLRAYKTVTETRNTLIYTIARTPQREKEFIWVGPILPRTTWIYGKVGMETPIRNIKDFAKAKIGVIRGEVSYDDLLAAGVPQSSILVLNSNTDVMRMMKLDKINVVVNTEIGMALNLKNMDMPSNSVARLMKLSDGGSLYFGLNLQTDPKLTAKLQTGIEKLKRQGKIDAIVRSYTMATN